jgi:hypothetical protein
MHTNSLNNKSAWPLCNNEPQPGENPYAVSNLEMTEQIMQRKRLQSKEMSSVPFNATCRTTMPIDDKVKVNSVNMMDKLDRAYLMSTNSSPSKIMTLMQNKRSVPQDSFKVK